MRMTLLAMLALVMSLPACANTPPSAEAVTTPTSQQSGFFRPATLGDTRLKGVRYIGKTVADIDAALAFYQAAVPFELVHRHQVPADRLFHDAMMADQHQMIDVALIRTPTVFLQLVDFDPDRRETPHVKPVYGPGYTHICFQSPATDPAFARFRAVGLEMVTRGDKPVDLGGYGVTYAYGRDPDGTMIENEIVDRPRRDDPAWITHIGGATPDVDRMAEFYSKLIGYGPRRRGEYADNPRLDAIAGIDDLKLRAAWFVVRNLEIEFWQYVQPATPEADQPMAVDQIGYNMTAFEVTDVDAERIRLAQHGIEMLGAAKMFRGWKILYARDPDGNIFSLQQNVSADASLSIDSMLWIDPTTF